MDVLIEDKTTGKFSRLCLVIFFEGLYAQPFRAVKVSNRLFAVLPTRRVLGDTGDMVECMTLDYCHY